MKTTLSKTNIEFFYIKPPFVHEFVGVRQSCRELSDFHATMLKLVGDAIRNRESQFFWNDGEYCWYTDATQTKIHRVWQTRNGILIYEDEENLYRVKINL